MKRKEPIDLKKRYKDHVGNNVYWRQFSKNRNDEYYSDWRYPLNGDKSQKIKLNSYLTEDDVREMIKQLKRNARRHNAK